jgi:hypothetical protein
MTTAQITFLMNKFSYPIDAWSDLEDISSIILNDTTDVYIQPTYKYYFDTTTELLKIAKLQRYGGDPELVNPEYNTISYVDFESIAGFNRTYAWKHGILIKRTK